MDTIALVGVALGSWVCEIKIVCMEIYDVTEDLICFCQISENNFVLSAHESRSCGHRAIEWIKLLFYIPHNCDSGWNESCAKIQRKGTV